MNDMGLSHKKFINRLNSFMKKISLNGNELAAVAGIKPQAISGYKSNSWPKAEVLAAWAQELGLNINWLLTGEGEMMRTDVASPESGEEVTALRQRIADLEKTIATQDKLVAVQEEALLLYRRQGGAMPAQTSGASIPAPGIAAAAPLQGHSSE